jgi:hypothetical protein
VSRSVEIPFSLQSLDLGVLDPRDRLLLAYRAQFVFNQGLFSEGASAGFSDPFALTDSPLLSSLTLEPVVAQVPAPAALPLLAGGLLLLGAVRRRG